VPDVWHQPLENARFCHGCGSPVEDGDTRAEYKQVTVLFADVVHSMDIAATVGAERLREIMADLADRCAAVVERYGGTVDKFTGDGIMAVFALRWRWRITRYVPVLRRWESRRRRNGLLSTS
jgi:class 3 adenylate cyclase